MSGERGGRETYLSLSKSVRQIDLVIHSTQNRYLVETSTLHLKSRRPKRKSCSSKLIIPHLSKVLFHIVKLTWLKLLIFKFTHFVFFQIK